MINVNVKFTSIEISKYIRNEPVTLKVLFNDGKKEHSILKTTDLVNINELADQIKSDAKKMMKDMNSSSGTGMFDGVVTVVFGDIDDEVNATERLSNSLGRIREDIRKMKNNTTSQNYLQRIAMFSGSRYSI